MPCVAGQELDVQSATELRPIHMVGERLVASPEYQGERQIAIDVVPKVRDCPGRHPTRTQHVQARGAPDTGENVGSRGVAGTRTQGPGRPSKRAERHALDQDRDQPDRERAPEKAGCGSCRRYGMTPPQGAAILPNAVTWLRRFPEPYPGNGRRARGSLQRCAASLVRPPQPGLRRGAEAGVGSLHADEVLMAARGHSSPKGRFDSEPSACALVGPSSCPASYSRPGWQLSREDGRLGLARAGVLHRTRLEATIVSSPTASVRCSARSTVRIPRSLAILPRYAPVDRCPIVAGLGQVPPRD
jgi:hypothetical protein